MYKINEEENMIDFEENFIRSKGQPIIIDGKKYHMFYSITVLSKTFVKIKFIRAISLPKQGVRFDADHLIECMGVSNYSFNIWYNPDKKMQEVEVFCAEATTLQLRNIWDNGDGVVQSWNGGGAMIVDKKDNKLNFYCNSTMANDQCLDCIFEVVMY